jgi:hypothetical protein
MQHRKIHPARSSAASATTDLGGQDIRRQSQEMFSIPPVADGADAKAVLDSSGLTAVSLQERTHTAVLSAIFD